MTAGAETAAACYNPGGLVDLAIDMLGLRNDADLARAYGVTQGYICKMRNTQNRIGPAFMVQCHEIAGISFPAMRSFIGGAA